MATTLTTLRDRVEATLQDATNARWSTDDIDEAIRKALEEFCLIDPLESITTITLAAAGREVDISAISGRLAVTRAWWPYTAADPEYPPNWCTYEVWGDVLFLDTGTEPAVSDVVRVWYTTLHTLNGLDGAAATTLPTDTDTVLVTGAAGFAAQQRAVELTEELNIDDKTVQKLSTYAADRLAEFALLLAKRARHLAAQASGIAKAPSLDRWDHRDDTLW